MELLFFAGGVVMIVLYMIVAPREGVGCVALGLALFFGPAAVIALVMGEWLFAAGFGAVALVLWRLAVWGGFKLEDQ